MNQDETDTKHLWTEREESLLMEGLNKYGGDINKIASYIKTRTPSAVINKINHLRKPKPFGTIDQPRRQWKLEEKQRFRDAMMAQEEASVKDFKAIAAQVGTKSY